MLFNSFSFAIFLPIVFVIYWRIPHKYRWLLTLVASYYFYMSWSTKYVFLILMTTVISYIAAILLEKEDKIKCKKILAIVIGICFGVLFFFKYFNFFSKSVTNILNLFSLRLSPWTVNLILPVGISFYTFQTISYVIDVYRGEIKAEHHFGQYAAFISFFPQLVAGPIERTSNLLPQIKTERKFDYNQATYGLKMMAWGYFKKIVIADTLSQYVSKVYNTPEQFQGFALVIVTVFFSIQIYCDFSGYSDIAIGTAKLLGINLTTNFKSPYFSKSIKEFWKRWHISLSTWFRDYIYIPLGGSRVGVLRHYFNLMLTFLLSGLWHGANWTFVVWGGIHGTAQVIEDVISRKYRKSRDIWLLRSIFVFLFCSFTWIFFVSNSISDAFYVISHMFNGINNPIVYIYKGFSDISFGKMELLFTGVSVIILFIYDYVALKRDIIHTLTSNNKTVRWLIYSLFVLWIIMKIPASETGEFIYFQF